VESEFKGLVTTPNSAVRNIIKLCGSEGQPFAKHGLKHTEKIIKCIFFCVIQPIGCHIQINVYVCITRHSPGDEIPNVTSLYFATLLAFNVPGGGVPLGDLCKILHGGQRMAKVQYSEEILPKVSIP